MNCSLYATLFVGVVLIATACDAAPTATDDETQQHTQQCPTFCTQEFNPICGYSNNCYRQYDNKCTYDIDKCKKGTSLETVDASLCDLAEKGTHPNYKMCAKE